MTDRTRDGGPAFPSRGGMMFYVPESSQRTVEDAIKQLDEEHTGLSLRDYFAAKALVGMIAEPPWNPGTTSIAFRMSGGKKTDDEQEQDILARAAYLMADAMLKARQQ